MMHLTEYLISLKDSFYGSSSWSNSSCPTRAAKWCVDDTDQYNLCIESPTLLPLSILALILGIYSSKSISKLPGKFPTRWIYQRTFFLFGMMMTSAGILHCFLSGEQKSLNAVDNLFDFIHMIIKVLDVGLTSNIAISFLFCGLCDIQFLNPQSTYTHALLSMLYCIVFLLWTLGISNQWTWIFHVLYLGVIAVCCFIYVFTQLCVKSNRRALPILFVGGLYGVVGLFGTSFGAGNICKSEGPYWSQYVGPEFLWFVFSTVSMAFIFMYVIRANQERKVDLKNCAIQTNRYPEKF